MAPLCCAAAVSVLVFFQLCSPCAAQTCPFGEGFSRNIGECKRCDWFTESTGCPDPCVWDGSVCHAQVRAATSTPNPMHMGCEVLHQAEMAGQFVDEQEQQWYDYAKKLCHSNGWAPGKVQTTPGDVLDVLKQKAAEYSQGDGNAVAKGCKDILKAKDDGKLEWFEKQPWYKGAMKICLAAVENENAIPMDAAALGDMKVSLPDGSAPAMVMKKVCSHLEEAKNRGHLAAVEHMPWYSQAVLACSSIEIASPEQIAAMVKEEAEQPESPSGQLLRQTCDKFRDGRRAGLMHKMETEEWFEATDKLCSALGAEAVPDHGFEGEDIVKKCMWLDKMREGDNPRFNAQWAERLDKMCSWLKRRGQGKGRGKPFLPFLHQRGVMDASPAPLAPLAASPVHVVV